MRRDTDLPEPPDVRPVRASGAWRGAAAGLVLVLLVVAAFTVPLPTHIGLVPGPIHDVDKLIEVEGPTTYSSEGSLYLTTVSIDDSVTFADLLRSKFDPSNPSISVLPREAITGGLSGEAYRKQQERQMQASKTTAQEVALEALGLADQDGAVVTRTVPGSPAAGDLEPDDVVTRIDGRPVADMCEVIDRVRDAAPGESVEVEVRRDGGRQTFDLVAATHPREPGVGFLGVAMTFARRRLPPDVDVTIDTGNIGGPSAGVMFALSVYDRLTPEDLTAGRKVAGSGEILECGFVAPVGGIRHKIAAAEERGAEMFIAPAGNADEAEGAADDIEVVSVETFDDAVEHLEELD